MGKKFWDQYASWKQACQAWDQPIESLKVHHPLKDLPSLPKMKGITEETAKNLKWKSFWYMLTHDHDGIIWRNILKKPFIYAKNFLLSLIKKKSYFRQGDFFFYGNLKGEEDFSNRLKDPNALVVLGFSYCHKPFECPSKRFSAECIHDPEHPVCRQCFIGKGINAAPEKTIPLLIPTIHYIGEKMFSIAQQFPSRQILFFITACELTLEMFGDWGNMVGVPGIGVRLDGRICNTMKAFEFSEKGIKPGLTVVLPETQKRMLSLLETASG